MTDPQGRKIRQAVLHRQSLNTGTMVRYPAELRREVLVYVSRYESAGESLKKIASRLGLRPQIISYWRRTMPAGPFRPVRLARGETPALMKQEESRPVLVTAQGLRVEGLDVAGLATLLRALS